MIGNAQVIIQWLFEQDKGKIFEITEKKQKRTLTANAYYWSLLNQLASTLRLNNDECHFLMLRRYGQYEVISVSITNMCILCSNARYSAAVSAHLGVKILSTTGSDEVLMNITALPIAPVFSNAEIK